jgi:hypothetical protein
MSTGTQPVARGTTNGAAGELREWRDHTRVFLQPIAAPSILGLYGFACATFMVTAYLVGWYGKANSPLIIFRSPRRRAESPKALRRCGRTRRVTEWPPPSTESGRRSGSATGS